MFTRHCSRELAAYVDRRLAATEARRVELHLEQCARCRGELELLRAGVEVVGGLQTVVAPETVWLGIEAGLRGQPSAAMSGDAARTSAYATLAWVTAAVLMVGGIVFWWGHRTETTREVGRIRVGEWIETGARSRANVKVGAIGFLEVEPNTRVRVVAERAEEHRFALAHGEIRASISAPPKLFFVDTAAGTAVDLGCEYSLQAGEDGSGMLRVTKGWVSFQWKGVESLVPAGASCLTRAHGGPGIPYFDDASDRLKKLVEGGTVEDILREARVRDTLTLWHLLSRVEPGDRARVYDRIAALTPVPAGISRELVLKLDPEALTKLKDELAWTW